MTSEKIRIAIVRVRGELKVNQDIKDTMNMLRLYKRNNCVVVPNTENYIGMINKIKDYVTWGEIDEETFRMLLEKRGKLARKLSLTEEYFKKNLGMNFDTFTKEYFAFKRELRDVPGLKRVFKLNPPRHGFERNGTKKPFSMGGALGYRKEKINELIRNMM